MRNYTDTFDVHPMLVGTIGVNGVTAIGNPVDVSGFADVMCILTYAAVGGTDAESAALQVRFQEAEIFGTGASYNDITDGAVMGSMKITVPAAVAPSNPVLGSTYFYELMTSQSRKRYIRPIIMATGAEDGVNFLYTISLVLGRARDTLYITKPGVVTATADEFTLSQFI